MDKTSVLRHATKKMTPLQLLGSVLIGGVSYAIGWYMGLGIFVLLVPLLLGSCLVIMTPFMFYLCVKILLFWVPPGKWAVN